MSKKIPLEQVQAAVKRVLDKRERKEVQVDMFDRGIIMRPEHSSHAFQMRSGSIAKEVPSK